MTNEVKNPKRVAAGKANRAKRKPLSAEAREKLKRAIRRNKPWLNSTGPVTPEGKKKSASNVRWRYADFGLMAQQASKFASQLALDHSAEHSRKDQIIRRSKLMPISETQRNELMRMREDAGKDSARKEQLVDFLVEKSTATYLDGMLFETPLASIPHECFATYVNETVQHLCGPRVRTGVRYGCSPNC